jgi:hypothetical protein
MWRTDLAKVGPAGPAGPIDLDHLARQTMGDRALAKEVLELFLGHTTTVLCRLKAAPSGPERREAAHALVGAARGIGAFAVARLAGEVEKDIAPDVDLAPLDAEVAAARRFIADFIGKE